MAYRDTFDDPYHAPKCETEACLNRTGHATGYCQMCRTRECSYCKQEFVIAKMSSMKETRCAYCRRSRCRKAE